MADEIVFYSIEQVAEMLKVNYQLVYNMIRKGEMPAVRVGKLYRVLDTDFRDYLLKSRTMLTDGVKPIVCSCCGKSYMSKLSIVGKCVECKVPICKACVELKHAKYCEIHEPIHKT